MNRRHFAGVFLFLCFWTIGIAWADDVSAAVNDETRKDMKFFVKQAVRSHPTIHDVGERIRITKGISPGHMAEFNSFHEQVEYPGDSDPYSDDFRDEAYRQLRAEIGTAYALLASSRELCAELEERAAISHTLTDTLAARYEVGKSEQFDLLEAQNQLDIDEEELSIQRGREQLLEMRLNILIGAPPKSPISPVEPLKLEEWSWDESALTEAYKSRRFLALFQSVIQLGSQIGQGTELHGTDSLDLEAAVVLGSARTLLDEMLLRTRNLEAKIIPRAELNWKASVEALRNGKSDYSVVLRRQNELAKMRMEYQSMLGQIFAMRYEFEAMTGSTLETVPKKATGTASQENTGSATQ